MNVYASVALSGDGYMDDRSPRRLILSTPADWREVMRLRAWADAILVGAETVRRDDPSLTVRDEALRRERLAANRPADPAKVTLSRSLRLAPASNFFTAGSGARIVFTDNAAASPLETAAEIVRIPDLSAARILTELEKRGFERLLVEGGPRTLGLFFAEGLVDTLRMAVNPAVRVGDPHAPRFEPPFDPARFPQQRRRLEGMEVTTYTLHPDRTEEDLHYLRQAIALSRRCTPCATSYRVGAVIVTRSGDRFTGYTHETSPTHHAEQEAILKATAAGADLHGASIYSSMEPCSTRSSEPESCSELILRHGFSRTVFALYEPSCFVCCEGAVRLRKGGVEGSIFVIWVDPPSQHHKYKRYEKSHAGYARPDGRHAASRTGTGADAVAGRGTRNDAFGQSGHSGRRVQPPRRTTGAPRCHRSAYAADRHHGQLRLSG